MRRGLRPTKSELLARLPRAFRPKLDALQRRDLALCHNVNLAAIATGQAEASMLWDFLGGVLLWQRAAEMMGVGVAEMAPQLEVATRLVERFSRTGRVAFDGPDYQLAKIGVLVMDTLASQVDRPTANAAADWSQAECDRMAAMVTEHQRQAA